MGKVRVLRVVEYVGDREFVEDTVSRSIDGTKDICGPKGRMEIRAATIGDYPEILEKGGEKNG